MTGRPAPKSLAGTMKGRYAEPMKITTGLVLVFALEATAQVVPTTPTKFGQRSMGVSNAGGGSASIGLAPGTANPKPVVKQISYIALSESRQWTSNDGKTLVGKVIAFEQMEQVLADGQTDSPEAPKLPARPTVIRDGKARLLVQQKPFELPLERLSEADQTFVRQLDEAIGKQAAANSP